MQTEKSYQRQFGVTGGFKSKDKKAPGKSGHRYYKNIGLGFKTPREAIEGRSNSRARKKCQGAKHDLSGHLLQEPTSTRSVLSPATSPSVAAFYRV